MNKQEKIDKITELMTEVMQTLGIEATPSTENTPKRVAKMYVNELFENVNNEGIDHLKERMTTFKNEGDRLHPQMIVIKDIKFHSTCEHHLLPFSGTIDVGYIPYDNIIGLSKVPRVVKYFSRKPQLQERLGEEIKDFLYETIQPLAVIVKITATHGCVMCRGIESECATVTYAVEVDDTTLQEQYGMYEALDIVQRIEYRNKLVKELNDYIRG